MLFLHTLSYSAVLVLTGSHTSSKDSNDKMPQCYAKRFPLPSSNLLEQNILSVHSCKAIFPGFALILGQEKYQRIPLRNMISWFSCHSEVHVLTITLHWTSILSAFTWITLFWHQLDLSEGPTSRNPPKYCLTEYAVFVCCTPNCNSNRKININSSSIYSTWMCMSLYLCLFACVNVCVWYLHVCI